MLLVTIKTSPGDVRRFNYQSRLRAARRVSRIATAATSDLACASVRRHTRP
jgi:hypothetical protein